jgi:hypothetical protein
MGAHKSSSLRRELGLYPRFTTKDPHTSLPRSCSHSGPTNPRNKSQTIPKRKQDSRSKGLSNDAQCEADGLRTLARRSATHWRTVCYPRGDGPLIAAERPDAHPDMWMVRTWSSDGPRATGVACTVRDPQADSPAPTRTVWYPYADGPTNPFRPETVVQTDRNEGAQEHATNSKNPRPKSSARTVRGL